MSSTQALSDLKRRLSDSKFLLVSLEGRLERNQQELATDEKLLATIDDTTPKIQRAIARLTAEGDTAGAARAQRDLEENLRDREQLQGNINQLRERVSSGQTAIANAQQDIRSLETQIAGLEAQGSGAVSTGDTTTAAQQARDQGAATQAPAPVSQSSTADGVVTDDRTTTVPSNAESNTTPVATSPASPEKLPPGTVGDSNTGAAAAPVPAQIGNQGPLPARQQGGVNLDTPDENNNRVSYIYRAYMVTSSFRQGRFTQDLQGAQIFFPISPQSASQQSPDAARSVDQSAAETARLQRQASARPQGTVAQTAGTPGVPISSPAAPGLLSLEGFDDPTVPPSYPSGGRSPDVSTALPGSSFAAEGFGDPTAEQVPATAPLTAAPVAPNIATRPAADAQVTAGGSGNADLQAQLKLARSNKTAFERSLADVEARIQRREGNPLDNRAMRDLYADNLRRENRIIAELESQQQQQPAPSAPTTTVAPQQGAREY